jgi:branched-subunit amino acid transport protein
VTTEWVIVVAVGIATVAIKAIGPLLLQGRDLPGVARRGLALLAPALLAALVVTQTFGAGQRLVVDARVAGVAVALAALLLRVPLLAAVCLAAVTTALLRAHG